MADKTVGELPRATSVTTTDLFVLEQSGQAKSLTGQVLIQDLATALDGHGGISEIISNPDYTLTFVLADETEITTEAVRGEKGEKGDRGTDGRAIESVTLTGTSNLIDTYTINFTDNTTSTFTVTNGSNIESIAKTSTSGLADTYTVTMTDSTTTTFTVTNGNGITSISLDSGTHAPGSSDVYKILFDNGAFTTFSVYNGSNGTGSVSTVNSQFPDGNGDVTLTGNDIPIDSDNETTVAVAVSGLKTDVDETIATAKDEIDTKIEQAESTINETISTFETQVNETISGFENQVTETLADVEKKKLFFPNTTVATSAFVADTTYEDYPYRASVALTGALATMIPEVVFSLADATSGVFAPIATAYTGGVYLYANSAPESAVTIPTIILWRGAEA